MTPRFSRCGAATLGAALLLTLSACAGTPQAASPPAVATASTTVTSSPPEPSATAATATPSGHAEPMELNVSHIHAAVRDPQTGELLLATHEGLYRQDGDALTQVGPVIDLMGFAVAEDGTLYASGHPSAEAGLPEPHRPWVPPLPERLEAGALPEDVGAVFALLDVPEEQTRRPLAWTPGSGHWMVVGAPGSGRTTALRGIVAATSRLGDQAPQVHLVGDGSAAQSSATLRVTVRQMSAVTGAASRVMVPGINTQSPSASRYSPM